MPMHPKPQLSNFILQKPIKLYVYQFIRDIYIFLYNVYRCSDIKYFKVAEYMIAYKIINLFARVYEFRIMQCKTIGRPRLTLHQFI